MGQIKRLMVVCCYLAAAICCIVEDCHAQSTWRRTYGGNGSNVGSSVRKSLDGGFVIAGSSGSFGSSGDAYLIKTDSDGVSQWSRVYGGSGNQTGVACRVLPDGYVIAGTTSNGDQGGYDMFLIRTDLSGEILWQRTYGTPAWDLCSDMQITSDGFALAGTSYLNADGDAYVVRTDFNGDTLWTRMFGGEHSDEAQGIAVSSDNALVIVGATNIFPDNSQAFVSKLNEVGEVSWFQTFGGDSLDYFRSVIETMDGGYACSGGTASYIDVKQILLVKVDVNGNSVWQEQYGSMGDSEGREIQENANGDLAIASYNSYANAGGKDMVLFLASSSGAFILGKNYGGLGDEEGTSVVPLPDGGYIIAGTAEDYGPGLRSIYVVRCDHTGETADDTVYEMFDPLSVGSQQGSLMPFCFPNPTTGVIRLTNPESWTNISLFDAIGRVVSVRPTFTGTLDLSVLKDGVYFLRGTAHSGTVVTAPVLLQKH